MGHIPVSFPPIFTFSVVTDILISFRLCYIRLKKGATVVEDEKSQVVKTQYHYLAPAVQSTGNPWASGVSERILRPMHGSEQTR